MEKTNFFVSHVIFAKTLDFYFNKAYTEHCSNSMQLFHGTLDRPSPESWPL